MWNRRKGIRLAAACALGFGACSPSASGTMAGDVPAQPTQTSDSAGAGASVRAEAMSGNMATAPSAMGNAGSGAASTTTPAMMMTTRNAGMAGQSMDTTASAAGASGTSAPANTAAAGGGGSTSGESTMSGAAGTGSASTVSCPPMSTLQPGDTTMRTSVGARDGGMRTYIVHVPSTYDGTKPVPLMVNFHPLIFGTGAGQRSGSGWAQIGDQDGIITAFPDGYDAAWDIGNCCTRGDVDDMAFAKAIVSEISAAACIDSNRVYASGYSMGGGMSHLLACKATDIFAAIAPSAFDLTEENHIPCEPTRPITMFMHRGRSDTVVPWDGGPTTPPNGTPVTVTMLGAMGTFEEWARLNKCTDDAVMDGNCHHHSQCESGVEVVLCENNGHTEGPAPLIWETIKKYGLNGPL
jgi:polyhydroxybutyrate depolymerase